MTVEADELARVKGLERLQGFLPYLEDEIETMKRVIITRAGSALTAGKLTPELSQALWLEFLAANTLLRRMGQKTRATQSVAERLSDLLTGTPKSE